MEKCLCPQSAYTLWGLSQKSFSPLIFYPLPNVIKEILSETLMISWRKSQEGWKTVNGSTMFQQSDQRWRGLAGASRGAGQVAPEAEWVSSGSLAWLSYQDHLPPIPGWSSGPGRTMRQDENGWPAVWSMVMKTNDWGPPQTAELSPQDKPASSFHEKLLCRPKRETWEQMTPLDSCLLAHEGAGFQSQVTQ